MVRELKPRKYVTPGNIELSFLLQTYWSVSCLGAMNKNTLIGKRTTQRQLPVCNGQRKTATKILFESSIRPEAFPRERKYNLRWTYRAAAESVV